MKLIIKLCLAFSLMTFTFNAKSQSFSYAEPKASFSVDLGIPTSERNLTFNNVLEGLFHGGLGYQYNVYKGLSLGVGANFSYFSNNRFSLNSSIGKGGLYMPGINMKVSYEKFTTERFSFNIGMRGGYSYMISVNDSSKIKLGGPFIAQCFFVEPQLEMLLTTEKGSPDGFSLVLGYSFYFKEYNAEFLSRDFLVGLSQEASQGITRFFSLGFGYRYYFKLNN